MPTILWTDGRLPRMPEFPQLSKPPIVEAILEVRVGNGSLASLEVLRTAHGTLGDAFPLIQTIRGSDRKEAGWLLKNAAGNEMLQVRRDRLTLNRLAPYSSWDQLWSHFERAIRWFRDAAPTETVALAAVRYVNQLELGMDAAKLGDHLTLRPTGWPSDLGRQVGFMHAVLAKGDVPDTWLRVVERVDPTSPPSPMVLVLELEASATPSHAIGFDRLADVMTSLRTLKNRAFFSVLTAAALERFR